MLFGKKQKQTLGDIFDAESVAIVGASEEKGKVGTAITENILRLGYRGKVFFVNPNRKKVFGKDCYASLSEIKEKVDLAVIVIPSKFVYQVVEEASEKVRNFVIISAGFSEIGGEGTKRESDLKYLAERRGLSVLGPNCLGFINPYKKLNASFAVGMPEKGNIAFISQSGALMVAAMDMAKSKGFSFSTLISIGNKMSLSEVEIMKKLENDKNTKVIGMYLESISSGRKFIEVASRVSRKKPIVILKAGKTEKSQRAISSHTGALSGEDTVMDAIFEKSGVIRAKNLQEFFEIIKTISSTKVPKNGKVAVVTNAGGAGVLTTDAFKGKKLELLEIGNDLRKKLREKLPEECSLENPIDVLGDAGEDRYLHVFKTIEKSEAGTVLCILTPQEKTPVEKIAKAIIKYAESSNKVVAASFIGGELIGKAVGEMKRKGVTVFDFPEGAIEVLDQYYRWSTKEVPEFLTENNSLKERRDIAKKLIEESRKGGRKAMRFDEASNLLALYGLNSIESRYFKSGWDNDMEIGYPVVAKVDSDEILHKTDQRALILNIKNKNELEKSLNDLWSRFGEKEILVQPMLERGAEVIIGINRDKLFGPIVVCGLGGIYAEALGMVDFFIFPMTHEEIVKKITEGKMNFLFSGARGQDKYNADELAQIIAGVMRLAEDLEEVREFDINPLFIYNNGKMAIAVDLKVIF